MGRSSGAAVRVLMLLLLRGLVFGLVPVVVSVVVGAAVVARPARVVALPALERAPVPLENLFGGRRPGFSGSVLGLRRMGRGRSFLWAGASH